MRAHHNRIAFTANSAVSWSIPTLTHPSLFARSYTPYGIALPSAGSRKSWTRTGAGCPWGRHSRPPFLKSPTNSFILVLSNYFDNTNYDLCRIMRIAFAAVRRAPRCDRLEAAHLIPAMYT